jgi:excisionase family DNA binding protein
VAEHAFTIAEFSKAFKVGRTSTYEEIASGRLATYRVGRRRFISARAAAEWQHQREAETLQPVESAQLGAGTRLAAERLGCRLVADLKSEELAAWTAAGRPHLAVLGDFELVPAKVVRRLVGRKSGSAASA